MEKVYKKGNTVRIKVAPIIWEYILNAYPEKTVEEIKQYPNFEKWRKSEIDPTIKQLKQFARKFSIPFYYFFLDKIPEKKFLIPFYRKGKKWEGKLSPELSKLLKDLKRIQNFLKKYLQQRDFYPLNFVGKITLQNNFEKVVILIKNTLELDEDWNLKLNSKKEVFQFLRTRAEKAGIFVFANSTLWLNTHKKLSAEEFKGFTLVDNYAPIIFINTNDFQSAQIFTLVHELVHVFLGKGEILGDGEELLPEAEEIEIFCNKVTAELLVPKKVFLSKWKVKEGEFETLAEDFKVSPLVIAIRAKTFGLIDEKEYQDFKNKYLQKLKSLPIEAKGFIDPYARMMKIVSPRFISFLLEALGNEYITYTKAYQYLNIKRGFFENFVYNFTKELNLGKVPL